MLIILSKLPRSITGQVFNIKSDSVSHAFKRACVCTGIKDLRLHDPRLTWNRIDIVKKAGGIPVQSKTGHASIKERMRAKNEIYGGEMIATTIFDILLIVIVV